MTFVKLEDVERAVGTIIARIAAIDSNAGAEARSIPQALHSLPTDDEWEDIATAPRDGSEFLSAGGINGRAGTSYATRWLSPGPYSTENGKNTEGERRYQYPDGFYWAGYDGFVGPVDPTIWRPLPAPPSD